MERIKKKRRFRLQIGVNMNSLSDYKDSRDNNFNLIRFVAASLVLVSHSFPLATGSGVAEPLKSALGIAFGHIAVDIFFITSGFLITGSLLRSKSTPSYIAARVLRIYPALIVAMLLTVFVLGPLLTQFTLSDYFTRQTFIYLLKNSTLFFGVEFNLPGVFVEVPWENAVNGSLWTLPYEVKMYAYLLFFFLGIAFLKRITPIKYQKWVKFEWAIAFTALTSLLLHLSNHVYLNRFDDFIRLFSFFFIGSFCYIYASVIRMSSRTFLLLTFFGLASAVGVVYFELNKETFMVTYILTLPYIVFYLAYIPNGIIRRFNNLGDYSYGIYIYAFPMQQMSALLISNVSVIQMIFVSGVLTLLLAIGSWHLVEKKALKLKPF